MTELKVTMTTDELVTETTKASRTAWEQGFSAGCRYMSDRFCDLDEVKEPSNPYEEKQEAA